MLSLLFALIAADPDDGLSKKMLPIYQKDAATYSIAVESDPKQGFEFKKEPVFEWLNEARDNTQGTLFVCLRDGRPMALACIFSYPHRKLEGRRVVHELHALDREKLIVTRSKDALNEWKPEKGLERKELLDAPAPADTAEARLVQMRRLAQEFSGYSTDGENKRWELKLLPTPLYRYQTAKTGVIDGALFALISTAGTDPEVLLVIEVREAKGKVRWEYAFGRFSDWELRVSRKEKEVYTTALGADNPPPYGPPHLYRVFSEKMVDKDGKVLARFREKTGGGTELIPVEDK
jgi:hypothetical protein